VAHAAAFEQQESSATHDAIPDHAWPACGVPRGSPPLFPVNFALTDALTPVPFTMPSHEGPASVDREALLYMTHEAPSVAHDCEVHGEQLADEPFLLLGLQHQAARAGTATNEHTDPGTMPRAAVVSEAVPAVVAFDIKDSGTAHADVAKGIDDAVRAAARLPINFAPATRARSVDETQKRKLLRQAKRPRSADQPEAIRRLQVQVQEGHQPGAAATAQHARTLSAYGEPPLRNQQLDERSVTASFEQHVNPSPRPLPNREFFFPLYVLLRASVCACILLATQSLIQLSDYFLQIHTTQYCLLQDDELLSANLFMASPSDFR
jgi:hypothetical protein